MDSIRPLSSVMRYVPAGYQSIERRLCGYHQRPTLPGTGSDGLSSGEPSIDGLVEDQQACSIGRTIVARADAVINDHARLMLTPYYMPSHSRCGSARAHRVAYKYVRLSAEQTEYEAPASLLVRSVTAFVFINK